MQIHIFIRPRTKKVLFFSSQINLYFSNHHYPNSSIHFTSFAEKKTSFSANYAVNTQLFLRVNRDFRKMKQLSL